MNKKGALIRVMIFVGMLVVPSFFWGLFSLANVKDELDFDLDEKREKYVIDKEAGFLSLPYQLEAYYNDRVPFRSFIISLNKKTNTLLENEYMSKIQPKLLEAVNKNISENVNMDKTNGAADTTDSFGEKNEETIGFFPLKYAGEKTIYGRDNWFFFANTLPDYTGENILGEEEYEPHISSLKALNDLCKSLNKELYVVIIPNKNSVYPEYMPTINAAEKRRTEYVLEYIKTNTDIKITYALDEILEAKKGDHRIYFKYDTHWNAYAYYAGVNALYKLMGRDLISSSDFEIEEFENTPADLVALGGLDLEELPPDTNGLITYKPNLEVKEENILENRYGESIANLPDEKKVVMVGDSYRYGFQPFMTRDFSRFTLIDRTLRDYDTAKERIKEADTIVIELVERNETVLPEDAQFIYEVLSQAN